MIQGYAAERIPDKTQQVQRPRGGSVPGPRNKKVSGAGGT